MVCTLVLQSMQMISVVGCVNAVGQVIPPIVIFDAKTFNVDWSKGKVPGTFLA